jgi:drug/metabolite transporter (DMT)-like permease
MVSRRQLVADLQLLAAAVVWGFCFVSQKIGMASVGPFTFNFARLCIGVVALAPVQAVYKYRQGKPSIAAGQTLLLNVSDDGARLASGPTLLKASITAGVLMTFASSFQQWGIVSTTAGKAGFLTGLYTVLTPIIGCIFGQRTHWLTWLSVAISIGGLYPLAVEPGTTLDIGSGELLVIVCSVGMAAMVVNTDFWLERGCKPMSLTLGEFATAMLLSLPVALCTEGPAEMGKLWGARWAVLATGLLEVSGYLLAAFGQDEAPPSHAALVMALEAPFAFLAGCWLLRESFTLREGVGAALMFAACVLSQMGPQVVEVEAGAGARARRGGDGDGDGDGSEGKGCLYGSVQQGIHM